MFDARLRKNLDVPLLLLTLVVVGMGITAVYSATRDSPLHQYQKQLLWCALGAAGLVGATCVDYLQLPRFQNVLYFFNLVSLGVVFHFAPETKGAQRWIPLGSFHYQPSEFAKLITIVCLAAFLVRRQDRIDEMRTVVASFLYVAGPMLLIFLQPDLGTALVLIAVWLGMVYITGARAFHLILLILVGFILFAGMWKLNVLKPYQKTRFAAFIAPSQDASRNGYQVRQATIAIGSGEVWGKGLGRGTQTHGKFIPENQTDFIYTVVGEEGGFAVSVLLVLLYGGILLRGGMIMAEAEDTLGRLLACGIVCMYAFHIVVNIGMTIGIMPVTGVPLPLISYGGSNLLLNMIAVGLLLGIGMRRHRLVF